MTLGTTTLNPGTGGSQILDDTLTAVNGAAAPADARTQVNKLAFGAPGAAQIVDEQHGMPVSQVSPLFWRVGFSEVGSGLQGLAAAELLLLKTGAGMAVSQAGGNLVVTTGTTANSETVVRSVDTFRGAILSRYALQLSQRIANQVFRVELADLIGEGLAYTINSATSVTVTIPGNPFTAANVGQSLRLSVLSSVGIPGRWAIASVSGNNVTFTVASWPASGSGTLTLYGLNWLAAEYSGTSATSVSIDAQRRGWASGNTTATINTTAAPGHVGQIGFDVLSMGYADALAASNAGFQWTPRASRITNIPDEDVQLYLFLVVQNGNTAPASTTTVTVGFLSVEDQPRNKVRLSGSDPATSNPAPVQVLGGSLVASIAASQTLATLTTLTTLTGGAAAEDAATTSSPHIIGGVVRTANAPTTLVAGDAARLTMTSAAQALVKQFAPRQLEWTASLALTGTTAQPLAPAAAAGIFNQLTKTWLLNTGASAIDAFILDGTTERVRYTLPPNVPVPDVFPTGIPTTAATALNINLSAAGTVRVIATGYTSA
jgi:hypothetical protein